jgi:hypothetical protein
MYPHPGVLETLQYDEYQKFMNLPADHLKTEFLVMGCDTEDSIAPSIVLRTMNSLHAQLSLHSIVLHAVF